MQILVQFYALHCQVSLYILESGQLRIAHMSNHTVLSTKSDTRVKAISLAGGEHGSGRHCKTCAETSRYRSRSTLSPLPIRYAPAESSPCEVQVCGDARTSYSFSQPWLPSTWELLDPLGQ